MYNIQTKTTTTPVLGKAAKQALLDLNRRMRYAREFDDYFQTVGAFGTFGIVTGVVNSSAMDYVVGSDSVVPGLSLGAPLKMSISSLSWLSRIDFEQGLPLVSTAYAFEDPSDTIAYLDSDEGIPLYLHEAQGISSTIVDLKALFEEEDSDGCTFKPTNHAFELALSFVITAAERLGNEFPRPNVVSDGEGGIRLRWVEAGRDLRLLFANSADRKPRLYHEGGGVYKIERDITPQDFTRWLRWLVNDERILRAA